MFPPFADNNPVPSSASSCDLILQQASYAASGCYCFWLSTDAWRGRSRYRRYTRWRQTSHAEAVHAEKGLLALAGCAAAPALRF